MILFKQTYIYIMTGRYALAFSLMAYCIVSKSWGIVVFGKMAQEYGTGARICQPYSSPGAGFIAQVSLA